MDTQNDAIFKAGDTFSQAHHFWYPVVKFPSVANPMDLDDVEVNESTKKNLGRTYFCWVRVDHPKNPATLFGLAISGSS